MGKCSPDQLTRLAPLLGFCHHQAQKVMVQRLRQYDVSPMQCRTLTYLYEAREGVPQKTLEQHLMVKPSTVNGIVGRLEEKGMLTRRSSKTDGRCRILHLTEQGRTFYAEFVAIMQQVNNQMERGFTPQEMEALRGYLLRVAHNLTEKEEMQ